MTGIEKKVRKLVDFVEFQGNSKMNDYATKELLDLINDTVESYKQNLLEEIKENMTHNKPESLYRNGYDSAVKAVLSLIEKDKEE